MAHLSINFISAKLGRAIDIDLILPSLTTPELGKYNDGTFRYQGQSPFPLLYLLHVYYDFQKFKITKLRWNFSFQIF